MQNRVYIIEGQDRCGKSTTVDILRNLISNPRILVIHSSKPPKGIKDTDVWSTSYYDNLIQHVCDSVKQGYDVILDRSWLGETVYGPMYRNDNIPLSRLEYLLSVKSNNDLVTNDIIRMLVLVDDASSIADRDDGLSMSEELNKLEAERTKFKESFEKSIIRHKELIDWSYETFSKDILTEIIKTELLND